MLEGALVHQRGFRSQREKHRLNPYCAGRCSRALGRRSVQRPQLVLILIVLEGALVPEGALSKEDMIGVLILIVLEGALVLGFG